MSNISLKDLRKANTARDKEWNTGEEKLSLSFRGNEFAGEAGELCNALKKLERERLGLKGSRVSVGEVAAELADVVICVDLIAMHLGVDLQTAIRDKFNETSVKHGFATKLAPQTDKTGAAAYLVEGGNTYDARAYVDEDAAITTAHNRDDGSFVTPLFRSSHGELWIAGYQCRMGMEWGGYLYPENAAKHILKTCKFGATGIRPVYTIPGEEISE